VLPDDPKPPVSPHNPYCVFVRKIRDWALTIPFLIAFGLTLLVFDIAARTVRPFSLRGLEKVMAGLQKTLVALFRISGTRVEVERSPLIERNRGYALVSNHQSLFDVVVLGGLLSTNYPKYVAKKSLGRWIPSISFNLRRGGNALIDRDDRIGSVRAIARMARTAQERDVSVVIFPEGTRSRDGALRQFHQAGTQTLLRSADKLAVVPVAIDGSWRLVMKNLLPIPFGTRVKVRLGDPIRRVKGDAAAVAASAEAFIRDTLASWRGPEPATA
jgi:1-acyl-sn-glycerol-3-phosphate acyltransferase